MFPFVLRYSVLLYWHQKYLNSIMLLLEATFRPSCVRTVHTSPALFFLSHAVLVASKGHVTLPGLPTGRATVITVTVAKMGTEGVLEVLADVFCIFIQIVTTINRSIPL
jgi:hypothetical protein